MYDPIYRLSLSFIIIITICACQKSTSNNVDPSPVEDEVCLIQGVEMKGDRQIGIDLLNITETNTFDENIRMAKEMGIEYIALHTTWSSLEPIPGNYTDPNDALRLLGQIAQANEMKFSLTIRPIDLVGKTVPSDLESTRFNTLEMSTRFQGLLDYIFTRIDPSVLLNIQIGNEIDGYDSSNEHPDFWSDYGAFLFNQQQYIKQIQNGIPVGFTVTYKGLMNNTSLFNALTASVDIIGVTYYPLQSNFSVQSPNVVLEDMDRLVEAVKDIDIYLQEVGYQTSELNASSEDMQAEFFCNFFSAWDKHADRLKTANLVRLNDLSMEEATTSAGPYGISDEVFVEYLRTLGLRTFDGDGKEKKAYQVIQENLQARGW